MSEERVRKRGEKKHNETREERRKRQCAGHNHFGFHSILTSHLTHSIQAPSVLPLHALVFFSLSMSLSVSLSLPLFPSLSLFMYVFLALPLPVSLHSSLPPPLPFLSSCSFSSPPPSSSPCPSFFPSLYPSSFLSLSLPLALMKGR